MNGYQFTYSLYHRRLRQPLHTSHGLWAVRSGIIVRLIDRVSGRSQAGEIAPIHWFGSESLAEAIEWCQSIGDNLTVTQIQQIPDTLPACQFGCGSAALAFDSPPVNISPIPTQSALLPTGAAAIDAWQALAAQGYSTFKWKIGVAPIAEEVAIWQQLMAADLFSATINLARTFSTPIALDESVATFPKLQAVYHQGWRGIYVIKPGIAGFPWRLSQFITEHQLDVVFSSVLETSIGRSTAFELAAGLNLTRAMGFGVENWFED
jgi:o-succinylbenzoate synthase